MFLRATEIQKSFLLFCLASRFLNSLQKHFFPKAFSQCYVCP